MAKPLYEKFTRDVKDSNGNIIGTGTSYMVAGRKPDWAMTPEEIEAEKQETAKAKKKRGIIAGVVLGIGAALTGGAIYASKKKGSSEDGLTADDQKYLESDDDYEESEVVNDSEGAVTD